MMGTDIERPGESIGGGDGSSGRTGEKATCGNGSANPPKETHENCPDDCCPPSGCTDDLEEREEIKEELNGGEKMADESEERGSNIGTNEETGFFEKITNWFRKWFN